jgi:AmpD protein
MSDAAVIRPLMAPAELLAAFALEEVATQQEIAVLDYPALPRLWQELADIGRTGEQQVLGAFDGAVLVGLVVTARQPDGSLHLDRVAVDPARQRQGWGRRLLGYLLAREPRLTVDAALLNQAACALYRGVGLVELRRGFSPDGLALVRFVHRPVLGADGRLGGATQRVSPNADARPGGELPSLLVVHNISLPPFEYGGDAIERLFTNRIDPAASPFFAAIAPLRVSSHFLIRRDGELLQFVSVFERAWHAGASHYAGRERCNDFSVGVELEGCDFEPFSEAQYRSLVGLSAALRDALPLTALVGHEDIAPGRKTDPGAFFDWARVRAATGLPA